MLGLVNRAIQCFVCECYGRDRWENVCRRAGLDFDDFEAMLPYDDSTTDAVLVALCSDLKAPLAAILEDIGTFLVSHPETEVVRRLLRFGGSTFVEFLHSLDELPERARLAVEDLDLPVLELREHGSNRFSLRCRFKRRGFGHVLVGILRSLADDYGALVVLEHEGASHEAEVLSISVVELDFAEGRRFDLGATAG